MARYALIEVTLIALLGLAATVLAWWYWEWWAVLPLLLTAALLAFYRDPPRRCMIRADAIIAPADGTIMSVEANVAGRQGEAKEVLRICIFLSVLNVHINRSPCSGEVREVRYHPGKYLNALSSEATVQNEANELILMPDSPLPGPIVVRQIAGLLARRIVCAAKVGERLTCGERFGMIKLGSQTQVSVPNDGQWRVLVKVGDAVRGGLTILAERNS
ncbi:MAG: phosphatidylserine decarboxylase [Phycisphaerales bacterium]|nr:phosphatidylserine decarboxylase [Phycisphaerales bacterium]